MSTTTRPSPLLDGPRRNLALGVIALLLALIAVDGLLTWIESRDADDVIDAVIESDPERYPTGVGSTCGICSTEDRAIIAAATDGDRLDRDTVNIKTWLAVIGLIAASALTIAAGPGSSRNMLAVTIVLCAAAFFAPLVIHADTIDIVTTAHGG